MTKSILIEIVLLAVVGMKKNKFEIVYYHSFTNGNYTPK